MSNLLDFNDFIASLSQDDKDYIKGIHDNNPESFTGNLADHDDFIKFIALLEERNYQKTLRLLDVYTDWMNNRLSS